MAERLAALLARAVGGDVLAIWRVSRDGTRAHCVATGSIRPGLRVSLPQRAIDETASQAWQQLAMGGAGALVVTTGDARIGEVFAIPGVEGDGLIVALRDEQVPLGAAVLWSATAGRFTQAHVACLEELTAPLSAALKLHNERDTASREREALEADRRALLQRLDRDELSDTLIGSESGLREVVLRAEQVAPTDAPVLLLGETGVGKEVIARLIHRKSRRASGPIVRVNCGAIPAGLIDSELFGHEKGSFTGAINSRKGWFERADGGTLFLDEIGELPLDAQIRLLRILQDGIFERVGAQRSHRVDVRIVAATHRDLQQMLAQRGFREDLWYRLSVFPIHIPPLRARPEDIPSLASHFAARAGARIGGAALYLTNADVDLLLSYPWPGNVRELAAVIERAAILGDGRRLKLAAALGPVAPQASERSGSEPGNQQIVSLDEAMARHIEHAVRACEGRIEGRTGAAALLRINPHTLRSRMRKLGVDWARIRDQGRA